MAKLGRNDPCWCGSERKYKRCHLGSAGASGRHSGGQRPDADVDVRLTTSEAAPRLKLMPSFLWKGKRDRIGFNRIHRRRPSETFHEFLADIVKLTFGRKWWFQQTGIPSERQHVAVRWWFDWADFTKQQTPVADFDGTAYEGNPPARSWP